MSSLFAQVPEAMEAWSTGDGLSLNAADLPLEAQQAVANTLNVMSGMGRFLSQRLDRSSQVIDPRAVPSANAANDLSKVTIQFNNARSFLGYRGDTLLGDFGLGWRGGGYGTGFMNPDSTGEKEYGSDLVRLLDGKPVSEREPNHVNSQHSQATGEQKTDFGEAVVEHQDDPALSAKIKLKIQGPRFDDLLKAVAKASGFAVVSDGLRYDYIGLGIEDKEVPLVDNLNKISLIFRCNWWRQGSVLEFRDRYWFRTRSAQVPEAWLEPWRKSLDSTETLDIDQLSQVALLDFEQMRENITFDDVLGEADLPSLVFPYGDLLRAYGCLSSDQRDAIFSDQGLDLGSISPAQWTTVARIFRSKATFTVGSGADITLQGKREQTGKQFKYTFTAITSAGNPSIKWQFTTPK